MRNVSITASTVLCCCFCLLASEITDSSFAFSVNLEPQWQVGVVDSTTRFIYHQDITKKTKIYMERILIDTISVISESEQAQIYFVANYTVAKTFGTVQFYDTSAKVHHGEYRAYELFAFFHDNDNKTELWWAEYCRWCSVGSYVYQLTILGDTSDVSNNFRQYASILNSITLWLPAKKNGTFIQNKYRPTMIKSYPETAYDLFGRILHRGAIFAVPGCRVTNGATEITLNRRNKRHLRGNSDYND